MSDGVEELLSELSSEGVYLDSSTFSLEFLKVSKAQKLYSLPSQNLWILKVIQAAVSLGALEISVTLETYAARIEFQPAVDFRAREVLRAIVATREPDEDSLLHIVTAICCSTHNEFDEVSWESKDVRVLLKRTGFQILESGSSNFRMLVTRAKRIGTSSLRDCLSVIEEFCWACPIRIYVNNYAIKSNYTVALERRLPLESQNELQQGEASRATALTLAARPFPSRSNEPDLSPKAVHYGETFLSWNCGYETKWCLFLEYWSKAWSEVNFVWDGVLVHRFKISGLKVAPWKKVPGISIRIVSSVSREDMGQGQFELKAPEEVASKLLEQVRPEILATAKVVEKYLADLKYVPYRQAQSGPVFATMTATAVATAVFIPKALLLYPVLLLFRNAARNSKLRKTVQKLTVELEGSKLKQNNGSLLDG